MSYKLLIVDDEPMILKTIQRQLADFDIEIITMNNSRNVKELLKNTVIDILITDQKMPGVTGLELVKYFHAVSPGTVLILMSAYTDFEVMTSAINEGHIFYFIQKPWRQKELLDALEQAVEIKRQSEYKEHVVKSYLVDKDKWMEATLKYEETKAKTEENLISAFKKIIDVKDKDLYLHSQRVAETAFGFAKSLGLDENTALEIQHAGEFHDLGKIVIKDRILYKESKLDEDEYEEMKRHPMVGADVLREIESFRYVSQIVEQHHERSDGKGYPNGLHDEQICTEAKIISMADAYDALVSERVYKKSKTKDEALDIMENGGAGGFNAELFGKFKNYILS